MAVLGGVISQRELPRLMCVRRAAGRLNGRTARSLSRKAGAGTAPPLYAPSAAGLEVMSTVGCAPDTQLLWAVGYLLLIVELLPKSVRGGYLIPPPARSIGWTSLM